MKQFYFASALLAMLLTGLTFYYRSEPDKFYGIADTKEIVISSQSAVEIRRIFVVQGQTVHRGDTLLELHNPELDINISQIGHELNELRDRKTAHATLSKSEVRQLKAQQQEKADQLRAEIRELEAQYNLNRSLVSELRSLDKDKAGGDKEDDAGNPLRIKIESLKKMLVLATDPSRVYMDRLTNAQTSSGEPLVEQVKRMEDELALLLEEKKELIITSQIDGLVGSVNFKAGEKVSPFAPIVTVHAASPSFVRGYIHEDVYSQVAVNDEVIVQPGHDRKHSVEGQVIGVGARIVDYPERLRKRADIVIWGREVIIRIPPDNQFLLGEKVLIGLKGRKHTAAAKPASGEATATASTLDASAAPALDGKPVEIRAPAPTLAASIVPLPASSADVPGIEASGLLYLEDLNRFLVISDDTPHKAPLLYLLDTDFRVERQVSIRGLDKIDDMESIAAGAGDAQGKVFIAASQSISRKGKLPEARKLLVRALRKGDALELEAKADLTDFLRQASQAHPDEAWAKYLGAAISGGTLDIEGLAWKDGSLLLGCKNPLLNGKAVVLRLDASGGIFTGKPAGKEDISIWKTFDLKDKQSGTPCGISDLLVVGGDVYALSTGDAGDKHFGELWIYRSGSAEAERLRGFGGGKPEGIARRPSDGSLYVAFDNGSHHPSQIMKLGALP